MLLRYAARASLTTAQSVARAPAFTARAATTCLRALTAPISSPRARTSPSTLAYRRHYSSTATATAADGNSPSSSPSTATEHDEASPTITFNGQPILWAPWDLSDLWQYERDAYDKHGVDFVSHLSEEQQRRTLARAAWRRGKEKPYTELLGEGWHEIVRTRPFGKVIAAERKDESLATSPTITFQGQPILWPPFTLQVLGPGERRAYAEHGADFPAHLDQQDLRGTLKKARDRQRIEKNYKEHFGGAWYVIKEESFHRFKLDEMVHTLWFNRQMADLRRSGGLATPAAKKAKQKEAKMHHGTRGKRMDEIVSQVASDLGLSHEAIEGWRSRLAPGRHAPGTHRD